MFMKQSMLMRLVSVMITYRSRRMRIARVPSEAQAA